jgi:hypothetical protein
MGLPFRRSDALRRNWTVRALPQVREALRVFGGHIEQIGRTEDGEVVR